MFTIIVPVYNKEEILEGSFNILCGYLKKKFKNNWKVIIAERGSTDNSAAVARKIARDNKQIKVVLGFESKTVLNNIEGNVIVIEPGLANNAELIGDILKGLKDETNGPDIFNGSRFAKGAKCNASFARRILSRSYNIMTNLLFRTKISDFQCEFKGYKENVFRHLCLDSDTNHRFWFTESLVRAARMDYTIQDFPVVYDKNWKAANPKRSMGT